MFGKEMKLLYETKFAIFCGRLCALSISSTEVDGKIVVTSSSDVSILLFGQMESKEYQRFSERLKTMLKIRTEDSSIIGIRVENSNDDGYQFIMDGAGDLEQLRIPLNSAKTEELSTHLMNCYVKEKSQNLTNLAKIESMSKQLQSKEYELKNLKVRCEYQNKEIQLLRQLNSSRGRKRRREEDDDEEEEEEVTSMDIEEDDDEEEVEEFKNVPLLRLVQTPSGKLVLEGNETTKDNGEEPSTSKTDLNNDETTTSVPDLMKKLGVIVRAPEGSSTNIQISKSPSTSNHPETSQLSKSPKKEMVVGVVQYVICQLCPENEQKHTDLEQMEAHLMDKHVDKEKAQCEACPSDQFQPNNIIQHMRIHTNSVYACQHCGKRGRKNYLRSHIRTHTGERPFSCDTCSKSFTDSSTLRRHRLVHTGEKKYQCPVCGRAIARKDNVKVHIRSHGIQI